MESFDNKYSSCETFLLLDFNKILLDEFQSQLSR